MHFLLSAGQEHDAVHAVDLLEQADISGSNILADKAYGTQAILSLLAKVDAFSTIPPKSNAREPWPVDWNLYKERHLVECFFQKLK